MIYELVNRVPLPPLTDPFRFIPPQWVGAVICLVFLVLALGYPQKEQVQKNVAWPKSAWGVSTAVLLASGIYTGMFIVFYRLIDEMMINLEHPYNLLHHGYFSMSSQAWVDGTVELVYYLLHVPFAQSLASLVAGNFVISYLVGLGHIFLLNQLFEGKSDSSRRLLQLSAFALCAPLLVVFSSGFGNGLVSLVFLAAVTDAAHKRENRSLVCSGLLPLLRPDAIYLSLLNLAVIGWKRRLVRGHMKLALLPLFSVVTYYGAFRAMYGHWIPTPVMFKSFKPAMLAMFSAHDLVFDNLDIFQPFHILAILILFEAARRWLIKRESPPTGPIGYIWSYVVGTAPLLFFYSLARVTTRDFSFGTFPRYWLVFEVVVFIVVISALTQEEGGVGARWRHPLVGLILVCVPLVQGALLLGAPRGRIDGAFAGAFTDRYLLAGLTLASSEMNTFGYMIDRPVLDMWGYSNPAIAFSKSCSGERIRNNPNAFLASHPDVFWPYWFTPGVVWEGDQGSYETVEKSLAEFHHTGRRGNLLGDMTQVLSAYDVMILQVKTTTNPSPVPMAYLVESSKTSSVKAAFEQAGFAVSRKRELDWHDFHIRYDSQKPIAYNCN